MYNKIFIQRLLRAQHIIINDIQYSVFELNVEDQIVSNKSVIFNFSGFFVKTFKKKGNQWLIIKFTNDKEEELDIKLVF